MVNKNWPSISVLIPTLNAQRVLEGCLSAVRNQDYPQNKIEVIVADGGSTDQTIKIAQKYGAKIYKNLLKTGEAGKAVALKMAKKNLVALIDSDNVLESKGWLKKMVSPFQDREILGSEPWEYTYRESDGLIDRYCALLGMNDPYCYFVGNYDRQSILSGRWTGLEMEQKDEGSYLKVKIEGINLPTIGANGTIWRTEVLRKAVAKSEYLVDFEILYILARKSSFYFAKVKVGIVHLYCSRLRDFYRKQKRRARDFFYQESAGLRKETYQRQLKKQLYFIVCAVTVWPLIYQAIKGYLRKPDPAWLFHPLACWLTLWIYASETILALFRRAEMSREEWSQ